MKKQQSGNRPKNQMRLGGLGTTHPLRKLLLFVALLAGLGQTGYSQVQYSGTANYSLRKVVPGYTGNAVQVRRSSDNATADIGFTPAGALDVDALNTFVLASNPLGRLSVNAAVSYSLRKMRSTYAGSAIQVRRSSDNATLDIGFTAAGDLDTVALKAFVGAGNSGFVALWYDQSGNGIHVSQPAAANQPRIVNAGLVDRKNGAPALVFDGVNDFFTTNSFSNTGFTGFTANILASWTTVGSSIGNIQTLFDNDHTCSFGFNMQDRPDYTNKPITMGLGNSGACRATNDVINTGNGSLRILSYVNNTTRGNGYRDGTLFASDAWRGTYAIGTRFTIGAWHNRGNVTRFTKGTISELSIFKSALSNTDLQTLESSQSMYYKVAAGSILGSNPLTRLSANSAVAYSLRRMLSTYTGSAIQVRRSSDNATRDIGFTAAGDLDTVALKAFVGFGNSGFVSVWYDQSGNGIHVSQPTAANQPRIVNAGLVDRKNGAPALVFDGQNDFFTTNSFSNTGFTGFTSNIMAAWTTVGSSIGNIQTLFDNDHSCTFGFNMQDRPDIPNKPVTMGLANSGACRATTDVINTGNGSMRILSYVNNTTTGSGYRDGTLFVSDAWSGTYAIGTRFAVGAWYNRGRVSRFTKGNISELTVFKSALSNTDREALESSQSSYYQVASPFSGGTSAAAPSAFVTTWYDQSGNGRHVTNATPSRQPQIMNAGMLYNSLNGNPSIYFNGGGRYLAHPFVLTTQPVSTSCIFNAISLAKPGGELFGWGNNSGRGKRYGCFFASTSDTHGGFGVENLNAAQLTSSPLNVNNWYVSSQVLPGANLPGLQQWINGSSQAMSSINAQTPMNITSGEFAIGTVPVARVQGHNGYMPEMSYYAQQLSNTRRILIESDQAAYYNLGIANIKYAPPASRSHIHYVNGVGRESATDKVSETSQSAGMGFMIGTDAAGYLKDNGDYLTCGMSSPVAASTTGSDLPSTVTQRWLNDWYLNKTDVGANNGQVTVYFDFSDYGIGSLPGNASKYVLLVRNSPSGDFALVSGATASVAGDQVRFSVDASSLNDGNYYTLGIMDATTRQTQARPLSSTGSCEGCKDKTFKGLNVYPNPVSSELTVELPGNTEIVNLEIFSSTGAVVYKGNFKQKKTMLVSSFPSGIYLIKVSNENASEFKRIIKK